MALSYYAPITARQRDYLVSLIGRQQGTLWATVDVDALSSLEASQLIDSLLGAPQLVPARAQRVPGVAARPANRELPVVAEGRYALVRDGVKFYKVDRPQEGKWAGWTFVKAIAGGDGEGQEWPVKDWNSKFEILAAIALNPREALERYGREIGSCGHCGRTLTDAESRARGIGPVCAEKLGYDLVITEPITGTVVSSPRVSHARAPRSMEF
jgi:hypothetical protein